MNNERFVREAGNSLFISAAIGRIPGVRSVRAVRGERGTVVVRVGWWRWLVQDGVQTIRKRVVPYVPAGVMIRMAPWWW